MKGRVAWVNNPISTDPWHVRTAVEDMKFTLLGVIFLFPWACFAADNIDKTVEILLKLCVSPGGVELDIKAELDGSLTIRNLKDSGIGSGIRVERKELDGFVNGITTRIEAEQATEVRECIKPYISRILSPLLGIPRDEDVSDNNSNNRSNEPYFGDKLQHSDIDWDRCREMQEKVETITSYENRSNTLVIMVENQLTQFPECAENLARLIPYSSLRSKAQVTISDRYLEAGYCSDAERVAAEISRIDVRSEQQSKVLIAMSEAGKCRWEL